MYAPEPGVNYDAAYELGRPLKTLAQLIKMDLGLRAATVDLGGWDTHEYQPGRFRNQVERLSQGLALSITTWRATTTAWPWQR